MFVEQGRGLALLNVRRSRRATDAGEIKPREVTFICMVSRDVGVLFSTSVAAEVRQTLGETVRRLGGRVVEGKGGSQGPEWTHFVTLAPKRGGEKLGFQKSLNTLIALAAGIPPPSPGLALVCESGKSTRVRVS
jgi:hypothetical protein